MATWNSRGLRGSALEETINQTNEKYMEQKLALINKIPTPITPIRIDKETRQITLAYFEKKSTVDYIGVVQGYPVCFDAKECATDTFSLANLHPHQIEYMKAFEEQGGISFFILFFSKRGDYYYLTLKEALFFLQREETGGPKNLKLEELIISQFIPLKNHLYVEYLKPLQADILSRENQRNS